MATGAAFDAEGNLFVGDRSGTIFKIDPERQIFVHATLEPSVAAYHLAVERQRNTLRYRPVALLKRSHLGHRAQRRYRAWYRGLGRPQGLASHTRAISISPPACMAVAG